MSHQRTVLNSPKGRLDPFCLTSETDSRFLLLIMTVAGTTLNLGAMVLVALTQTESTLVEFAGAACVVLFVFGWTWFAARRQAARRIERDQLEAFPPSGSSQAEQAALEPMSAYVRRTVQSVPELKDAPIRFLWDGQSWEASGVTFGFARQWYVCLRQGLLLHFLQQKIEAFRAVLLHELGHVANRDLAKTTFSIQLGKCFQWTTLALLAIFDGLFVRKLLRVWLGVTSGDGLDEIIRLVVMTNLKSLVILLLVEIIRASILRVREYYADARANLWMGRVAPLFALLNSVEDETAPSQSHARPWMWVRQQFRARLAPLHPTREDRRAALTNRKWLFRPSQEVAFFAGLLIGISLNSNFLAFTAFQELPDMVSRYADPFVGNGASPQELLFGGALIQIAYALFFIGMALVCTFFVVAPMIGTLGVQLQRAAIADRVHPDELKLSTAGTIVRLAGIAGGGTVLGFWLTPLDNALSLSGRALWFAPLLALGWSALLATWLALLSRFSGRFLGRHRGTEFPRRKRRWLSIVSTIALLPALLVMTISQAMLTTVMIGAIELTEANGGGLLLGGLVVAWGLLPVVSAGIWGLGWVRLLRMERKTAAHSGRDWTLASDAVPAPRPSSAARAPAPSAPPPL